MNTNQESSVKLQPDGSHRVVVSFQLTDEEALLWGAGIVRPGIAAHPWRDAEDVVHFLYDALYDDPERNNYWCSCGEHFGEDGTDGLAHLVEVAQGA